MIFELDSEEAVPAPHPSILAISDTRRGQPRRLALGETIANVFDDLYYLERV
jgi:hypothetical protein